MEFLYINSVIATTILAIALLLGFVNYILMAAGVHSLCRRRGIRKGWLAWLPVLNLFALGSVSDQYQYVVKGRIKSRRTGLFVLSFLMLLLSCAIAALQIAELRAVLNVQLVMILTRVLAVVQLALLLWFQILYYKVLFDLFRSCCPEVAVLLLVISILFSGFLPLMVYLCRKSEAGMPPRRPVQMPQ